MFGSNFFGNFGIPDFAFQTSDAQGGLFAPNVPPAGQIPGQTGGSPPPGSAQPAAAAALGPSSPLSSAALTGNMTPPSSPTPDTNQTAPAAGVGSPFGRPNG